MMPEENKFADVPIRVKTWVYIIIVFGVAISHPALMKIFVVWITFQSFFEILRLFKYDKNRILSCIVLAVFQMIFFFFFSLREYFIFSSVLSILFMVFFYLNRVSGKQLSGIFFGLMICLTSFPHLLLIRTEFSSIYPVIFVVVVTELNDVFQYLSGKFFGKHKIVPGISPNKTVEGFLGGVLLTIILSNILGYFLLEQNFIFNTIIGLILGIFGFCGDVLMSYIKRKTNFKDTGNLLPGHGGLLDRMDSLVFNAPLFFWIFYYTIN